MQYVSCEDWSFSLLEVYPGGCEYQSVHSLLFHKMVILQWVKRLHVFSILIDAAELPLPQMGCDMKTLTSSVHSTYFLHVLTNT